MSFVVKKRDLTDPAQLQALIVEHADDLERGLTILDSRLLLGQATIDVVGLDADGALVLIAVGLVADEEMLLKAVDAYSWCLEYPDAIRRLYPAVQCSTAQPPRVMFVVERMPDAFHRKIKQLGFHEVDCVEFRHLDVDGTAAIYFDTLAQLRRGTVPTAPAPGHGAAPVANGRPTRVKLQKLLGADRPAAVREPAPVVRMVHRATPRPEPRPIPSAPRAERVVAPNPSVEEPVPPRRTVDEPAAATSRSAVERPPAPIAPVTERSRAPEPVAVPAAPPVPSLDMVAASADEVAGVPEILAQDLDAAEGMLEPFATVDVTVNGHGEPPAIQLPEPEPVIRELQLTIREPELAVRQPELAVRQPEPAVRQPEPAVRQPEPAMPQLEPAIGEPELADVPVEIALDVVAAELFTSAEPVAPEPLTLDEAPALVVSAPEPEAVDAVAPISHPEPELVVPVLELEPRSPIQAEPEPGLPVIAVAEQIVTEPEPAVAALGIVSSPPLAPVAVEPVAHVAAPPAAPSVFSRRPPEAVAARDAKVSFAGMAKDLLPQNHRTPETEPPVSAPRASVEEITRAALDDLVGATDKRTTDDRPAAFAKPGGPFAKAPSQKRPRTIAPPPADGPPIAGGPKLGSAPKRVAPAEAAAPPVEKEEAQAVRQGFEGLQFPNDGVLTRQWMEFLNQMAAGK